MSCSVCLGYSSTKCPCCGETHSHVCSDCNGKGVTPWLAWDMEAGEAVEVSESYWHTLSDDEDEARGAKQRYYRYEEGGYRCRTCNGDGRVPVEYY